MPELTRRYVVMTMAAVAPFDRADRDAPFVLKPWKDPAALIALKAYRRACYPELARELDEWIRAIEAGPLLRGDVGLRNETHLTAQKSMPARPGAKKPRARSRAKAKPRTTRSSTPRRVARSPKRGRRR